MSKEEKAAIFGGIAIIIAAVISYWTATRPVEMSIQATQTAETKVTQTITPISTPSPFPSPVIVLSSPTPIPATASPAAPPSGLSLLPCQPPDTTPAALGRSYQIQAGDWLSAIANREYGAPLNYRAIVYYNNQRCQANPVFTCIHNPDAINVNWTIYLPTTVEVSLYWDKQLVALPPLSLHNTRGDLKVVGSSTVYPLTRQLAECFSEEGFEGEIAVESTGTLAGFEAFCRGEADLVNASHAITAEYLALCRSMGREPVEFQVGNDALSIAVSQQNDFVEAVTTAELTQILATAERWAEVRPGWPDEPIHRFYPTERSGTFASVVEILFSNDSAPLLQAMNVTSSEDDEVLVESLVKDKFGVGFFGYAYYARNQEQLRTLPVNGVRPIPETVDRGTYPLVRPLFIYSSIDVIHEKPQVAAFINYYLRSAKDYIIEVGYFLPDEAVSLATIERFNEASR